MDINAGVPLVSQEFAKTMLLLLVDCAHAASALTRTATLSSGRRPLGPM